ncbi:filamin-C-like isoform X2 [Haliotis asinina]|uniref:filamin-C-like isoform X2 n=1 Tax=Haliotis asinina TaxID=109174 RepID=UPI0035323D6C
MSEVDIIGNQARSREGRGLSVRGGDSDKWITIQKNTFQNWINLQLHGSGMTVDNLQEDLCDGVKLCALVAALQQKPSIGRVIKKPNNQHQYLENVTLALNAIAADNIRLVNIGSEDIVNGSLKLILGLIWHLILRYQIGKTKFPPKKLMLAWLKAVVPECQITNFTSDWNDGVNLHAVIEYCQPGLCPDWRHLSRQNRLDNCRNAMTIARDKFDIPLVVRPEDLASPHLDDLSGMTYLSYFMNVDSPGYMATLRNVNAINTQGSRINDFGSSWNDGTHLCNLVKSLGQNPGPITPNHVDNLQRGIDCGRRLGVEPILSAKEMADPEVEHLGIMAYAAYFTHLKPVKSLADKAVIEGNFGSVYVGQEKTFRVIIDDDDVSSGDFRAEVIGPDSIPPVRLSWSGRTATGSFTPSEMGQHRLNVYCMNEPLASCPIPFKVSSDRSKVTFHPVDRCPVGVITELKVDTSSAGQGDIRMEVETPNGHSTNLPVVYRQGMYTANFTPAEVGDHRIFVHYDNEQIVGSPFLVKAFDPSKVNVYGLEGGSVGRALSFTADSQSAGEGELTVVVTHNGVTIPSQVTTRQSGIHNIDFTPQGAGTYRVQMYFNDVEIRGSPYTLEIVDSSMVSVSGDGLSLVPVNKTASFNVHTRGAGGGNISVDITCPDGREVPTRIRDVKGDQHYRVEWTPTSIGDYKAVIEYADMPIKGSPFTVKAFDAANVKISKINQGFLGRPNSFTLDASEAGDGNLEIQVTADGESVPNYVRQESDTNFRVSFTPQRASKHHISVRFNGEPVPGSPFSCGVVDSDRIHVSGEGIKMVPANVLTTLKVDPKGEGDGDLSVRVFTPSGHEVPVRVSGNARSAFRADYTPHEIGLYKVHVEYSGVEIKGSPFTCNVYDPSLIRVNSPGRGYLGRPIHFQIDTSAAGTGDLEAEVKCRGSNVASHIREIGRNRYELSFTPRDLSTHIVTILFNRFPLPGSPYHVDIIDSNSVTMSGEGLHTAQVYKETWFNLDLHGMDENDLEVHITSPSGSEIPCRLSKKGHVCRAEYTPLEVGQHMIDVFFAGTRLQGSPFVSQAYDPSLVRITDVDKTAKKEREIAFTVDASQAGVGDLDAVVTHHGHSIHTYRETIGDGRYRYTFTPTDVGHYDVNVKFNDEQIPGCPVVVNVEEQVPTFITINFRGVEALNVRDRNHFILHMDGHHVDSDALQTRIKAPSGELVPANLVRQSDGDYKVEWTPTMAGKHSVDVLFAGQQIQGSPFFINVFDINKIRVDNFYNGGLEETAGFNVDASQAGRAEQSIWVVSPSGRNVPVDVQETRASEYAVSYVPHEVGRHKIHLTYGALEHPGSPFTQEIGEGALATAHGDGLYRGEEDKPATFFVESGGITGEPTIQVDGPNSIAKCSIDPQPGGRFAITYVPVETGLFDITVKWNGRDIHGSPFHPRIVDARKVRVIGGWQHYMDSQERIHLVVGEEKHIPFETAEAGPGKLTAEVRGPTGSIVPCTVDDSYNGKSTVIFTPREEGHHTIHLNWSGHPLSGSAFSAYATGGFHDITKIILSGRGLKEATVREEAEFFIDGSQAGRGEPQVQLTGVRAEVNVIISPLGGGKYRCTYIPVIPGAYLLHITWNDRHVKGAPFKVNVIGAFYPNKVAVTGEGLKGGLLGRDLDIRIDTRKAGPGELTAFCTGPNKVAYCDLEDNRDGTFRLLVKAQEAGRHVLQVKYGGEHVLGSPFVFRVSAQPDASKVRVSGPGVEHGILACFQSRFIVETRGAGAGQLMVRIRGPKGAFQVEMYRDSQKDRTILCRFDPTETGLYIIHVKWSNLDVPGSPFHVHIVDTQQELEQVLKEESYPNSTLHSSRGYSQWREEF